MINSLLEQDANTYSIRLPRLTDIQLACLAKDCSISQLVQEVMVEWLDAHGYAAPELPELGEKVTYQWHSHTREGFFVAYDEKNRRYYVKDCTTGIVHKVNKRPTKVGSCYD